MNERSWLGFLISFSGNLKSKIQNRQSLGVSVMAFVVTFGSAVAQAQQPKKVPRIGYLSNNDAALESAFPRQFDWLCASLATSKDRTSSPSTDMRRGSAICSLDCGRAGASQS